MSLAILTRLLWLRLMFPRALSKRQADHSNGEHLLADRVLMCSVSEENRSTQRLSRLLHLFPWQEFDPKQTIDHSSSNRVEVFIILLDFAFVIKDEDADIRVIIAPSAAFHDAMCVTTHDARLY